MKTLLTAMLLAGTCHACLAAGFAARQESAKVEAVPDFEVERLPFGSGTPTDGVATGTESARAVIDGLYHVPNYMPGYPTAATIWPRELAVECEPDAEEESSHCNGYRVSPAVGRGEYIFVRPYAKPAPQRIVALPPAPQKVTEEPPRSVPVTHKKPLE